MRTYLISVIHVGNAKRSINFKGGPDPLEQTFAVIHLHVIDCGTLHKRWKSKEVLEKVDNNNNYTSQMRQLND